LSVEIGDTDDGRNDDHLSGEVQGLECSAKVGVVREEDAGHTVVEAERIAVQAEETLISILDLVIQVSDRNISLAVRLEF